MKIKMQKYKIVTKNVVSWRLVSECCQSVFDPLGLYKGDGTYQEVCLKCGKACEIIRINK